MKTRLAAFLFMMFAALALPAQCTGAFTASASPTTIAPGQSATLYYSLSNSGPPCIAAVNIDIAFDASAFAAPSVTCGTAASGAGKVCQGNPISAGNYRVIVYGGITVIPNGAVALVTFPSLPGASMGAKSFTCSATAADAAGDPVTVTSCAAVGVTIAPPALSCSASATPTGGPAPLTVSFTSSGSGGTPSYAYAWQFGDGGSSTQQNPSHTYLDPGIYSWTFTLSDQGGQTCVRSGAVEVGILDCAASASPLSGEAPLTVAFSASADQGIPPYTYAWQFGDGEDSTEQNPTHIYNAAGTYGWTLTVSDSGGQTCHEAGTVQVSQQPVHAYYVAASARTAGAQGTHWKTDLVLYNREATAAQVTLYFLEAGKDNSQAVSASVTMDAGSSRRIEDAVGSLFGKDKTAGALRVECNRRLLISSNTYNDQGEAGTYGQSIPGTPVEEALGEGETGILIHHAKSARYRTNIGFCNATAQPMTVLITVYRENGSALGQRSYLLRPYEFFQESNLIALLTTEDVDNAFAFVQSPTAGAGFFAYASSVDNRTGDAVFIPAMR